MPRQKTVHCRWAGWDKGHGRHVKGLADKLECEQKSLYDFRHTFISYVRSGGTELNLVQKIAGHSKNMDTDGIYGHETERLLIRAAKSVDDTFTDILN